MRLVSFLGLVILSSWTTLAAGLAGSRITGLEASARGLTTLGSDVSLTNASVSIKVLRSTRVLPACQGPCWRNLQSGSFGHPCGQCFRPLRGGGCWSFRGLCLRPLWVCEWDKIGYSLLVLIYWLRYVTPRCGSILLFLYFSSPYLETIWGHGIPAWRLSCKTWSICDARDSTISG